MIMRGRMPTPGPDPRLAMGAQETEQQGPMAGAFARARMGGGQRMWGNTAPPAGARGPMAGGAFARPGMAGPGIRKITPTAGTAGVAAPGARPMQKITPAGSPAGGVPTRFRKMLERYAR